MPSTTCGSAATEWLAKLSRAIVTGDAIEARACMLELASWSPADVAQPPGLSGLELVVAAAMLELLAERAHQSTPPWTAAVGGWPEPVFLVESALRFPNLRRMCETESPAPLKRRNLFAPANYLTWA